MHKNIELKKEWKIYNRRIKIRRDKLNEDKGKNEESY